VLGEELGQLKDELKGGKIMGLLVLAPKTYMIAYVDIKTKQLMVQMKCKGIPHYKYPYPFYQSFALTGDDMLKAQKDLFFIWTRKDKIPIGDVVFKQQRFAVIESKLHRDKKTKEKDYSKEYNKLKRAGKNVDASLLKNEMEMYYSQLLSKTKFITRLTWDVVRALLKRKVVVECMFPVMTRKARPSQFLDEISVTPDYMDRQMNKEDWWMKGNRTFLNDEDRMNGGISYPEGHLVFE
jgi:hypothetical protein